MGCHIAYNVSDANNNQYDGINQTGNNEQRCPINDKNTPKQKSKQTRIKLKFKLNKKHRSGKKEKKRRREKRVVLINVLFYICSLFL